MARESAAIVSVDLTHLEFIDCAARAVLAEVAAGPSSGEERFVLVGGSGQVRRMFD